MSVAANRYAKALLEVLYPDGAELGLEQLVKFSSLLNAQSEMRQLFENPTVAADRRKSVFNGIADALAYDGRVRNFLNLLIERNRLDLLSAVIRSYQGLLDEKLGLVRAHVTSASPLDPTQQRAIAAKLETVTGKKVRVELSVDPTLLGGVVAQVGSTIYDGSLRQQLQTFKQRLAVVSIIGASLTRGAGSFLDGSTAILFRSMRLRARSFGRLRSSTTTRARRSRRRRSLSRTS